MLASSVNLYRFGSVVCVDDIAHKICHIYQWFVQKEMIQIDDIYVSTTGNPTSCDIFSSVQGKYPTFYVRYS